MHLKNSLAIYDSERDRDFAFRFGQDTGVSATIILALTLWPLGEIKWASQCADKATTQAAMSTHVATEAFAHGYKSLFEMMRAGCWLRLARRRSASWPCTRACDAAMAGNRHIHARLGAMAFW